MSLAAYVRERSGHTVTILDNRIEKWDLDHLVDMVLARDPEVIGLTGLTFEAWTMVDFSARIRKKAPGILQVAGGIHANTFAEEMLRESGVDIVVLGEGEETFNDLLEAITSGRDLNSVPGIAFLEGDCCIYTPKRDPVPVLDDLPFPAWDLVPLERYFGKRMGDLMFSRPEQASLFTSRGCPYGCIYCHNLFGRAFRAHSAARVFEEINTLHKEYGIREFQIQDDVFNYDMDRSKAICRRIIENRLDIVLAFPNGVRADRMDDELIDLLYQAGTRRIAYGVESASPRIQKMIKKKVDLRKVSEVAVKTARKGILVKGYFMLGFPSETEEEMQQTIDFARDQAFHVVGFGRAVPLKGTEIYLQANAMGLNVDYDYNQFVYDYSNINMSNVDDKTFERMLRKAFMKGYLGRPSRLFRLLKVFPNKRQIFPYYFIFFLRRLFLPKRSREASIG